MTDIISMDDSLTGGNAISVDVAVSGDKLLPYTMPRAEYMYGCTATAMGMLAGYYDLYGYMGYDVANLIEGTISVESRGSDGNKYNMNEFDSVLGNFIASAGYKSKFYQQSDSDEFNNAFLIADGKVTGLNTVNMDCLAAWLGTGTFGRSGGGDLSTSYYLSDLAWVQKATSTYSVTVDGATYSIPAKFKDFLGGFSMYAESVGYSLDAAQTGTFSVDVNNGGRFTFDDYKAEIDAGRAVIIHIEGHSMTGYGYNAATREIIFDDTYDHDQRMVWDGTYNYSGKERALQAISVIRFDTEGLTSSGTTPPVSSGGGLVIVASGGLVISSGSRMAGKTLSAGGALDAMKIFDGGVAESTTIGSGGWQIVSGGSAVDTTVSSGGLQQITAGGVASRTIVKSGGLLRVLDSGTIADADVYGTLLLSSGGSGTNIEVKHGGYATILGTASNAGVEHGGTLGIVNTGVLSGTVTIGGELVVSDMSNLAGVQAYRFELGNAATSAEFLWLTEGDFDAAGATVTVDVGNAWGDYILVDGTDCSFDSFSLSVTGAVSGTASLSLGGSVTLADGKKVSLAANGSSLILSVSGTDTEAPATPTGVTVTQQDNVLSIAWDEVTDFSGVFYEIEYAAGHDFANARTLLSDFDQAELALPSGNWYWRVRAVDGAENVSDWTATQSAQVHYTRVIDSVYSQTLTLKSDVLVTADAQLSGSHPAALQLGGNDFSVTLEGGSFSCAGIRNAAILFGEDAYWVNNYGYGEHYDGTVNFTGASASLYSAVGGCITAAGILGKNLELNFTDAASGSKSIQIDVTNRTALAGNFAYGFSADESLTLNGDFGGDIHCHFDFAGATSNRSATLYGMYAGKALTINGDLSGTIVAQGLNATQSTAYGLFGADTVTVDGEISGVIAVSAQNSAYAIYGSTLELTVTGTLFAGKSSAELDRTALLAKLADFDANRAELTAAAKGQYAISGYAGRVALAGNALAVGTLFMSSGTAVNFSENARLIGDLLTSRTALNFDLTGTAAGHIFVSASVVNIASSATITVDATKAAVGEYILVESAAALDSVGKISLTVNGETMSLRKGGSVTVDGWGTGSLSERIAGEKSQLVFSVTPEKVAAAKSDFTGDGKSDLFFAGDIKGDLWAWNGGDRGQSIGFGTVDLKQNRIAGIGDYNGDGRADILWHCTDGTVGIWGNGDGGKWQSFGNASPADCQVKGTADFDADGKADVLWQCSDKNVGYWKGGTSEWMQIGVAGSGWSIAGAGDFDGNGKLEILWQEDNGLNVGMWFNGTSEWKNFGVAGSSAWRIADVGDCNGDGKDSILWANDATGGVGLWSLDGHNNQYWTDLGQGSSSWQVEGTLDFDGNGVDDIVWREKTTGEYGAWLDGDGGRWKFLGSCGGEYRPAVNIAG